MFIFKWFRDLIAKLLDAIKKLLPYILLGLAIYFSLGLALPAAWPIIGGLQGASAALGALGMSFLFAPGETAEVIAGAADGISDAATAVISSAGDVLSSASDALLSGAVPWIVAGLVAFGVFTFIKKRGARRQATKVAIVPIASKQRKEERDGLAVDSGS